VGSGNGLVDGLIDGLIDGLLEGQVAGRIVGQETWRAPDTQPAESRVPSIMAELASCENAPQAIAIGLWCIGNRPKMAGETKPN
jgi:hypothetical protein